MDSHSRLRCESSGTPDLQPSDAAPPVGSGPGRCGGWWAGRVAMIAVAFLAGVVVAGRSRPSRRERKLATRIDALTRRLRARHRTEALLGARAESLVALLDDRTHRNGAIVDRGPPPAPVRRTGIDSKVADTLEREGRARVIVSFEDPAGKTKALVLLRDRDVSLHAEWSDGISITADAGAIRRLAAADPDSFVQIDVPLKTMTYEGFDLMDFDQVLSGDRIALASAAPTTRTLSGGGSHDLTGAGQTVALIDSGLDDTHAEFAGRVLYEWDFQEGDGDAQDDWNHGTRMAGIIAAGGVNMEGAAPQVGIVSLKVTDASGQGWLSHLDSALDWVAANATSYNITSVYIGVGSGLYDGSEAACTGDTATKVATLKSNNVAVFTPAGHDGNWTAIAFPACVAGTISVGAVPDGGARPADTWDLTGGGVESNRRDGLLDVLAPGGDGATMTTDTSGYTETTRVGTSVAAAYATGAAMLLREYWDARGWDVGPGGLVNGNIPDTIERILSRSGVAVDDPQNPGVSYPRIDLQRAVNYEEWLPIVTLESDQAINVEPGANVTLAYNVVDVHHAIANCSLYVNNVLNQTNFAVEEGVTQHFDFTNLGTERYNWRVSCYDNSSRPNKGDSRTYTIHVENHVYRSHAGYQLIGLDRIFNYDKKVINCTWEVLGRSYAYMEGTGVHELTGRGQTVCIIDSGINYFHQEFNNGKQVGEYDFYETDNDPQDSWNHGSRVAGIMVSKGYNYQGIAHNARFINLRITNSTGGEWTPHLVNALDFCYDRIDPYNITTVYIGIGTGMADGTEISCTPASATGQRIQWLTQKNVTVVATVGIDSNWTRINYPACVANAISVGAVPSGGGSKPADTWNLTAGGIQSNRREGLLDILAPGGSGATATTNRSMYIGSTRIGTHIATAYVAGAAMLMREYWDGEGWENYSPSGLVNGNIPNTIEHVFKQTGKLVEDEINTGVFYPRLDLYRAINYEEWPPVIALQTANGTMVTPGSLVLSYVADDRHGILNATLYLNAVADQTHDYVAENRTAAQTQDFTVDVTIGDHTWYVSGYDGSSVPNQGSSPTYNLRVRPLVEFDDAASSGLENVASPSIPVSFSEPFASQVTVDYTVTGGTASGSGTDYTLADGTLTFDPGVTTQNVPLSVVDDPSDETDETVEITLYSPVDAVLGTTSTHTYTIQDDDDPPEVALDLAVSSGDESVTPVNLSVSLSVESGKTVTVDYSVTGGTASGGGTDYALAAGQLVFDPGVTSRDISITIAEDLLDELDETIEVTLSAPANATLGTSVHTYTILDNDDPPSVGFDAASSAGLESVTPANLTVSLSAESGKTVTVDYAVTGGDAAGSGEDYALTAGQLTFNPGVTSQDIAITAVNDLLDENDETIEITLSAPSNATDGTYMVHTYTIQDDDNPPSVSFTGSADTVGEAAGTANLDVVLSAVSGLTVTVNYSATDGTATGGGMDYTLPPGSLTFAPGETTKQVSVSINNDGIDEADEDLTVSLAGPSNATLGGVPDQILTIIDDDGQPSAFFSTAASSGDEGIATANLEVTLSNASGLQVTVGYSVTGGDATGGGVDFTLAAGTLTFNAGETTKYVPLSVAEELIDEADETVVVELSGPVNATLGANPTHTYTILDNDAPPSVGFASGSSAGAESLTAVNLAVSLSAASGKVVTVDYAVTGGDATGGGADYTLTAGQLTFNPGETVKDIAIVVANDPLDELDETIEVTLTNPVNATPGADMVHTYTIEDDDAPPVVEFALAASSADESASSAVLDVTLSTVSGLQVTVNYAVSGGDATGGGVDYILLAGTLTFLPGETAKQIAVSITDDAVDEADETVLVDLAGPSNATLGTNTGHVLAITDNDAAPTVSFDTPSSSVGESAGTVAINVVLSTASGYQVTVVYGVSGGTGTGGGVDYTLAPGSLTFAPGETTKQIDVDIVQDTDDEADETVEITLSAPTNAALGATPTCTFSILDDDATPTVAFAQAAASVAEDAGSADLQVVLSAASGLTVTVDYAATGGTASGAGTDYTLAAGTVTFAPGETTKQVVVTVDDDLLDEDDETVEVALSGPVNATLGALQQHVLTINDDDAQPNVSFSTAAASGDEGIAAANLEVILSNASGRQVTVDYVVTGGNTTGGGVDFTLAAGTLTFDAGETTQYVPLSVVEDLLDEVDETVVVQLSGQANATLGANPTHTYAILDNDSPPEVGFVLGSSAGAEAATAVNLAVVLSAESGLTVTVDCAVSGGDATGGGTDYTLTAGQLTFNPGETAKDIAVAVVSDLLDELDETIEVTLRSPVNAAAGADMVHTYTIQDDDAPPEVEFALAASSVDEGVPSALLDVDLSTASALKVTVDYSVSGGDATGGGTDYTLAAGMLTFLPGETAKQIAVSITDDAVDEADETVLVDLAGPSNATLGTNTGHVLAITDNDAAPTVSFDTPSSSVGESAGTVAINVVLSTASGYQVTVVYGVSGGTGTGGGVDYTLAPGSLTFAPGETTKQIDVDIVQDTDDEADETVEIALSSPTNATTTAPATHELTIVDDDASPGGGSSGGCAPARISRSRAGLLAMWMMLAAFMAATRRGFRRSA